MTVRFRLKVLAKSSGYDTFLQVPPKLSVLVEIID